MITFREKYASEFVSLDSQLQERFGMTLMEFWEKIQPKDNPLKDDPQVEERIAEMERVFDWHQEHEVEFKEEK